MLIVITLTFSNRVDLNRQYNSTRTCISLNTAINILQFGQSANRQEKQRGEHIFGAQSHRLGILNKALSKVLSETTQPLTSDLEDTFSSMSESLGSTISSNGGRVGVFFSSASFSILTFPTLNWDLSFVCFLSAEQVRISGGALGKLLNNEPELGFFLFFAEDSSVSSTEGLFVRVFFSCCCPHVMVRMGVFSDFGSLDMGLGSLKAILGTIFSSFSGLFSLGFLEDSLEDLLCSLEGSLKALFCSFESLETFSLCSFVNFWVFEKLLLLLLLFMFRILAGSCKEEMQNFTFKTNKQTNQLWNPQKGDMVWT